MSKKKKKQKAMLPLLVGLFGLFLLGILALLLIVRSHFSYGTREMNLSEYYHLEQEEQAAIITNQEIGEETGLVIDGVPYASWQYITGSVDASFYWDEENQAILYTTESGTSILSPDAAEPALASGAPVVRRGENGTIYLSLEYVAERKGMDYQFYQTPNRVVLTDRARERSNVTVQEETEIRYRGGNKSEILKHVPAGEELWLLEELENWVRVASADGLVGYVPRKKISEKTLIPAEPSAQEAFHSLKAPGRVNLIWHQTTSQVVNGMIADTLATVHGTNVISPTWYSVLDHQGNLSVLTSASYVATAHERGMQVWGLIDNFNPEFDTAADLARYSVRAHIIEQLITEAVSCGMDGINVDFEALSEASIPHYLQFLRELTAAAHPYQLIISVDTAVPASYTYFYNRGAQGEIVDYMIMMGYDEHYAGSEKAGSVASISFVENGIREMLGQGIPQDKVVCGVPLYTRIWTTPKNQGAVSSEVLGMNGADERVLSGNMTKTWDEETAQYLATSEDGTASYAIWLEEEESLGRKAELVAEYQLAGIAAWKLGFERETVWDIFADVVNRS